MQDGSGSPEIRVLVADEISRVVRDLQAMQQASNEIGICGFARTPAALIEEARRLQPNVILINEGFFGVGIIFAAAELVHVAPDATVVVMTSDVARAERRGRGSGIKGFVPDDASTEEVVELIRSLLGVPASSAVSSETPAVAAEPGGDTGAADDGAETAGDAPAWGIRGTDGDEAQETAPAAEEHPPAEDDQQTGELDSGVPPWTTHDLTSPAAGPPEDGDEAAPSWAADFGGASLPETDEADVTAPGLSEAAASFPPDLGDAGFAGTGPVIVPEPLAEAEQAAEPEPIQPVTPRRIRRGAKSKAEIFFVFSGKGGVGKSTVAANLAVALATDREANVAVVDLDLQFGDIGIIYGIDAKHSIEALVDQGEQVDPDYLEDTLSDGPAGVRVLLAPPSPELADLVTSANLRSILRELSRAYDYVVVDGPAHLEERTLEVIELADQLIVVTAFNVTAVKDTKVTLKVLSSLGVDKEKISIVLNQTRARANFTREQVEENLRFRVVSQLPYDPRIVDDAIDHGRPFVLTDPKADISRQIRSLVDFLSPATGEPRPVNKDKSGVNRRRFSLGRG